MSSSSPVIALQTSRQGSESLRGKNVSTVRGRPLFRWNLEYARRATTIDDVFCVTDIPEVDEQGRALGCKTIWLPTSVANGKHYQAIRYGVEEAEALLGTTAEVVVILLGNALGARTSDLNGAVELLLSDSTLDSVCSVSEFNAFNPVRAFRIDSGQLEGIVPVESVALRQPDAAVNEKHVLGDVYFFNGSFWVCRRKPLFANGGNLAFPWLGNRVIPWVQPAFMEVDAAWQLEYLRKCDIEGCPILQ